MNTKGDGLFSLQGVVGLILGVIILIFLLNSTPAKEFLNFFSRTSEEATYTNFDELVQRLNIPVSKELPKTTDPITTLLAPSDNHYWYVEGHGYYVSNKFIVVGFNNDTEGSADECEFERVLRPTNKNCKDTACLCLYPEHEGEFYELLGTDDDFASNPPQECASIDADYIFTLDYHKNGAEQYGAPEKIYKNIIGPPFTPGSEYYSVDDYARLFVYGQCEDWTSDINLGVQKLYIEKVYDYTTDKTYIFLMLQDKTIAQLYKSRLEPDWS